MRISTISSAIHAPQHTPSPSRTRSNTASASQTPSNTPSSSRTPSTTPTVHSPTASHTRRKTQTRSSSHARLHGIRNGCGHNGKCFNPSPSGSRSHSKTRSHTQYRNAHTRRAAAVPVGMAPLHKVTLKPKPAVISNTHSPRRTAATPSRKRKLSQGNKRRRA